MCEIYQLLSGLWWPGDPGLQPKKISLAWKFILHYLFAIKVPLIIYICSSRFCVWLNTDVNEGRVNHFCVIAVSLVGAVSWSLLFFLVVAWSQEILYPGYSQCPKKELPSNFENRGTEKHLAESEKSFRLFEVIKSKFNIFAIGRQN